MACNVELAPLSNLARQVRWSLHQVTASNIESANRIVLRRQVEPACREATAGRLVAGCVVRQEWSEPLAA